MKTGTLFGAVLIAMCALLALGCQGQAATSSTDEQAAGADPAEMTQDEIAAERTRLEQRLAELDEQQATAAAAVSEPAAAPAPKHSATSAPAPSASSKPLAQAAPPSRSVDRAPAPAPKPEVVPITLPAGTLIDIEMATALSSETNQPGDLFTARVADSVVIGELIALPAGTLIEGQVKAVKSAEKKIGGKAQLELEFDRVIFEDGSDAPLHMAFVAAGEKQSKKDAATIGGAAAGGALLGRLLKKKNKSKGTLVGAILGGAVGAAIAANNPGDPVQIAEGTVLPSQLQQPLNIDLVDGQPTAAR